MGRPLLFVLALLAMPASAGEHGGACQQADWVCVSECIDRRCSDRCLADHCAAPIQKLRDCAVAQQCAGNDRSCAAERCGPACLAAFGRAKEPPDEEVKDPCAKLPKVPVPRELVGGWNLQAASIEPLERRPGEDPAPQPRADYEQVLKVSPQGCFVLESKLEDATLGQGNALVVRSWGTLETKKQKRRGKDRTLMRFHTRSGQALGELCAKSRVIDLAGGKFVLPSFAWVVEGDTLTLTSLEQEAQTFQFKKGEPEDLRHPPHEP